MDLTTAVVQEWAELIVPQLGAPAGHSLTVAAAESSGPPFQPPATGGPFASSLRVEWDGGGERPAAEDAGGGSGVMVTLTFSDGASVFAILEGPEDEADAVVLLADQLQDGVLEETGGEPVPACPAGMGHGHPAVAEVVDGVASWTCPSQGGARPIIPPAHTTA